MFTFFYSRLNFGCFPLHISAYAVVSLMDIMPNSPLSSCSGQSKRVQPRCGALSLRRQVQLFETVPRFGFHPMTSYPKKQVTLYYFSCLQGSLESRLCVLKVGNFNLFIAFAVFKTFERMSAWVALSEISQQGVLGFSLVHAPG